MAKKIWYSTPLKFYWDEIYAFQKKITPYLSDEKIFQALRYNAIKNPSADGEHPESRELYLIGLDLWKQDLDSELLHIFFTDKKLKTYLQDMSLADLEGVIHYLYLNGINKKVVFTKINDQKDCVVYTFGIHIPYETNGYAFTFNVYNDDSIEMFYTYGKDTGGLTDKIYFELIKQNDKKSEILTKMFRLAINTIAYMKCFPECVSDGVPKITIERDEDRSKNNITFNISDKVSTNIKKPHFRRGYFKLLKSEFYINKKDQLIFVHETMVKGRAKTVSTTNKIKNVDNLI